jgi:hypothetical protein
MPLRIFAKTFEGSDRGAALCTAAKAGFTA